MKAPKAQRRQRDMAHATVGPYSKFACKPLPPLLFRVSHDQSQGDNPRVPFQPLFPALLDEPPVNPSPFRESVKEPVTLTTRDFIRWQCLVYDHISRRHIASPYTSWTPSILRACRFAQKRVEEGKRKVFISVLDTCIAYQSHSNEWIQEAHDLIDYLRLITSWHGHGEFMIWGEVPAASIIATARWKKLKKVSKPLFNLIDFDLSANMVRYNLLRRAPSPFLRDKHLPVVGQMVKALMGEGNRQWWLEIVHYILKEWSPDLQLRAEGTLRFIDDVLMVTSDQS